MFTGNKPELLLRLYTGQRHSKDEEADLIKTLFQKNEAISAAFKEVFTFNTHFTHRELYITNVTIFVIIVGCERGGF